MISSYDKLESLISKAMVDPENIDEDGFVNWSYVDADVYSPGVDLFGTTGEFYSAFDAIVEGVLGAIVKAAEEETKNE